MCMYAARRFRDARGHPWFPYQASTLAARDMLKQQALRGAHVAAGKIYISRANEQS